MATLKIYEPTIKPREPAAVDTAKATLPLSLALQKGKAVSSVGQAFADIVNHIGEREDENQAQEIIPKIINKINTEYTKYSNSSDIKNSPILFEKALTDKSSWFKKLTKNTNKRVTRALTDELNKKRNSVIGSLITAVSSNSADKTLLTIESRLNLAMANRLSGDQSIIGIGETDWFSLINNKALEETFGAKKWKEFVDKKKLQFIELQVSRNDNIDPTININNKEQLIKIFGTDQAEQIVQDSKEALVSKMAESEDAAVLEELKDNKDKTAIFSEILLRIQAHRRGTEDVTQDMVTLTDLKNSWEEGLITEPMFSALTRVYTQEEDITDEAIFEYVTEQLASANTLQQMEDLTQTVSLDPRILAAMDIGDMTLVHSLVNNAKKDFPKHKQTQFYLKQLKAHYKNLNNIKSSSAAKFAAAYESKRLAVERNYLQLIADGINPKAAYINTIATEFDLNAIPNLNHLEQPKFLPINHDWETAIRAAKKNKEDIWSTLDNEALKSFEGHQDLNRLKEDLNRIELISTMYALRYQIQIDKTPDERITFAVESGIQNYEQINFTGETN